VVLLALNAVSGVSVPMLAQHFVAMLLSWIGLSLYRGVRDRRTQRGDALVLDLFLGLVVVAAGALWFSEILL
jgi:hypothetical protein